MPRFAPAPRISGPTWILFVLLAGWLTAVPAQAADQPNVVLFLVDDLGWSDLGCYGNPWIETPAIDRFAKESVRFTDFYAACPVCSPTRASIQSGQYQARFSLTDFIPGHWRPFEKLIVPENAPHLPLEIVTVAEALKPAGYTCGYFGKWHLGGWGHYPHQQGYDQAIVTRGRHFAPHFHMRPQAEVEDGTYLADFLTDQVIDFMQANREGPFFVQLSHYAVHIPLEAEKQKIQKYQRKPKPEGMITHPTYAAMVEHVDDSLRRILAALDELKLADNTLVLFTSDNGALRQTYTGKGDIVTSNDPLRDEKGTLYEGGIQVPLIVRWPGVSQPGACREPTISIDFYPTLLDAAAAQPPRGQVIDGRSLRPVLKNPQATLDREAIYFHYPHYHHSRPAGAVRAGDYKLIEFFDEGKLELYNLADDLGEKNNLAPEQPAQAKELQAKLQAWRKQVDARMPTKNPKYDPARASQWWSRRSKKPLGK